jgi:F-type H+-transporting ATPase subunit delta
MSEKILSAISKNYAKALMESTSEENRNEYFVKQLDEISKVFSQSEDLNVVMSNSSVSANKKIEILDEIFKGKINEKLLNLMKILVEKNRFGEFDSIITGYKQMTEKQENKKTVEIISPIELDFENKTKILFKLEKKLKNEIVPEWTVDKSLIAGLVFKFDDYVIDTSVKAKLEDLRKTLNRG